MLHSKKRTMTSGMSYQHNNARNQDKMIRTVNYGTKNKNNSNQLYRHQLKAVS